MRDLFRELKYEVAVTPVDALTSPAGIAIDRLGYEDAIFVLSRGQDSPAATSWKRRRPPGLCAPGSSSAEVYWTTRRRAPPSPPCSV